MVDICKNMNKETENILVKLNKVIYFKYYSIATPKMVVFLLKKIIKKV